jgi:hypothetical protein
MIARRWIPTSRTLSVEVGGSCGFVYTILECLLIHLRASSSITWKPVFKFPGNPHLQSVDPEVADIVKWVEVVHTETRNLY